MSHIFISYSHKDKEYVNKLQAALRKEGFTVWTDEGIPYGNQWPTIIQRHLDECGAFIIVMSMNAYKSEMVQNECTRARELGKPVFPLLLEGKTWLIFQARQYFDVRNGSVPTENFYKWLEVATPRQKPVLPPVPPPPKDPIWPKLILTLRNILTKSLPFFRITGFLGIGIVILWAGLIMIPPLVSIGSTPVPTITPAATGNVVFSTVAPTAFPTIIPTESILLYEDFAGGDPDLWKADGWIVRQDQPNSNSYWWPRLLDTKTLLPAWYADDVADWSDYIFQSQVQVFENGSLSLCIRANEEKAYYAVTLQSNQLQIRQFVLNANSPQSLVINTKYARLFDADGWHTVQLSIKDNTLTTTIDDIFISRDTLPAPLVRTTGGVGFIASGKVYVDSIKVWSLK